MDVDTVTVNGQAINIASAALNAPMEVGQPVRIIGSLDAQGQFVATQVGSVTDTLFPGEAQIVGTVESFDGNNPVVSGQTIDVTTIQLDPALAVGQVVRNIYLVGLDPTYLERANLTLWNDWAAVARGYVEQPSDLIRADFGAEL